MSLATELSNMSLEDASKRISYALIEKKYDLVEKKKALSAKEIKYKEDYVNANTGDASENAPLDEAKKNLRNVAGDILENLKILQTMDNLEDVVYLVATYDYMDIEVVLSQLSAENFNALQQCFEDIPHTNVKEYFTSLSIEEILRKCEQFMAWVMVNNPDGAYNILIQKIADLYEVASMPQYNTCGIVKIYSTVRLKYSGNGSEEIMTFKIYPKGLSFLDIGIIAADSRLAQAILEKEVGQQVYIMHASKKINVLYEILDIY